MIRVRNHRLSLSPIDNSSCVVDVFEGQMLLVARTKRKPVLYELSYLLIINIHQFSLNSSFFSFLSANDQKWLLLVVTESPKLGHSSIFLTLHFSSIFSYNFMHKLHGDCMHPSLVLRSSSNI
ncbi:unnamed protein product [Brugia pahangi]|uniref:Ovule protein n=1 Tax=Brugia pahangi TaxID=6280 RepID=A0A0N4T0U1_BRUPA|nr:unnamed protein product [Brugia pahangi]